MATTFNHIQPHGSSNSWPRGKKLCMPLIISMPSVLCKWRHPRMILNIFFITIFISNLSRSLLFTTSSSLYLPNINLSHWNWLWKHTSCNTSCSYWTNLNLLRGSSPNWFGKRFFWKSPLGGFLPIFTLIQDTFSML